MDYSSMVHFQREMSAEPVSFNRTVFNPPANVQSNYQMRRSSRNRRQNIEAQCKYCLNRMSKLSLVSHMRRKHSQLIVSMENASQQNHPDHGDDVSNAKRRRLSNDQPFQLMENDSIGEQTPLIPFDFEEPAKTPFVQFDGMSYNLVHVSDFELNKLIGNGLIRVLNGNLFLVDSDSSLPNEEFERTSEMDRGE